MKNLKLIKAACIAATLVFSAGTASSMQFTFNPIDNSPNEGGYSPYDLNDLDHGYYYVWSINNSASNALATALSSGQKIVSATLTYHNIWDWTKENNDNLATYLLQDNLTNPPAGGKWISPNVWQKWDNSSPAVVPWSSQSALVGNWNDPNGGSSTGFNLVYNFGTGLLTNLNSWAKDGNFGFGIDPDCHYFNDKVEFTVVTAPVPEPGLLFLVGTGLLGLGFIRRKKLF